MMKNKNYIIIFISILFMAVLTACSTNDSGQIVSMEEYSQGKINNDVKSLESFDKPSKESTTDDKNADISVSDNGTKKVKEESIFVYVCGCVQYPDVYELHNGDRVVDAIRAAGGTIEGAGEEYLNLASSLHDGEKLYVPSKEEAINLLSEDRSPGSKSLSALSLTVNEEGTSESGLNSKAKLININTADAATLQNIPGVGEAKAQKIISYRDENGGFSKIEDIMNISGIKEGMFNKIKDYICVE